MLNVNLITGSRKRCTRCRRLLHAETCFTVNKACTDGRHTQCRTCKSKQDKAAYEASIEERRAKARADYAADPEKFKARKAQRYREDPHYRAEQLLTASRTALASRRKRASDPRFVFEKRIRDRLSAWLKSRGQHKEGTTFRMLGYSSSELQQKLLPYLGRACESCLRITLTLGNSEIDHIVPLCTVTTLADVVRLNQLDNLRLICGPCNRSRPRPSVLRNKQKQPSANKDRETLKEAR